MEVNRRKIYTDKKNVCSILLFAFIIILYEVVAGFIYSHYNIVLENPFAKQPFILTLFGLIILAPLFETWLCQYLPLRFLKKWIGNETGIKPVYISISGLFFASQHFYSIWYVVAMVMPGLMLAYCFYHFYKLYQSLIVSFWFTAILHAIINLVGIAFEFLRVFFRASN
jgi:Type II CAAX prenyl endopeptidase Rce1-like